MSMITTTTWVPRGFPAQFPTKREFDQEEFDRISKLAQLRLDDAQESLKDAQSNGDGEEMEQDGGVKMPSATNGHKPDSEDDDLAEYDLDHYDDPPNTTQTPLSIFSHPHNLAYHTSNAEDPYITLPTRPRKSSDQEDPQSEEDEDPDDASEREELQILPTDNLLIAGRIDDEMAHLEIYVYEDDDENLYVHHDVMLPSVPLAVEWLDVPVGRRGADHGNCVAVGTMDPDIEIWDLDIVDGVYPSAILGSAGDTTTLTSGQKPKKKQRSSPTHHTDAVLALKSNSHHRNLLASASADKTVKLWDLNSASSSSNGTPAAASYTHHTDKVCALAWHPTESTALLSGSYDRTVVAADMRVSDSETARRRWDVDSDIEVLAWDPFDGNYFYAATESGMLHRFDARVTPSSSSSSSSSSKKKKNAPRQPSTASHLQAHTSPLNTLSLSPHIPGLLATASDDRTVKIWDVAGSDSDSQPRLIASRDPGCGRIFSVNFAPDEEVGLRLAVAGSKGAVKVWDVSTNKRVREAFGARFPLGEARAAGEKGGRGDVVEGKERLVSVDGGVGGGGSSDEDEDDDDDDDDEDDGDQGEMGQDYGWEDESDGEGDVDVDR